MQGTHLLLSQQSHFKKESVHYLVSLMLTYRILGGYLIFIYPQFCSRSVQDMLTANIHLIRTALEQNEYRGPISRVVCIQGVKNPDFLSLIKDPQSLPLQIPRQPENYIRDVIKNGLCDIIINRDIKPLFNMDTKRAQEMLIRDLKSTVPCNLKLTNNLYASSNLGLQEKWIEKLSNSRSIQQTGVDVWVNEYDVYHTIKVVIYPHVEKVILHTVVSKQG